MPIKADAIISKEDKKEIHCLAQTIQTEASGEGLIGQAAVAMVVINRKKSDKYPTDICKIIAQPGQFPWYKKKKKKQQPPPKKFINRAEMFYSMYYESNTIPCEKLKNITNAMYFNTIKIPGTKKIEKIGGHVFSK